jgi:hypothetical protein
MKLNFSQIEAFLFALLVLFVIYRRFRRNFGQQLLSPVRMRVRMVILLIVSCVFLPGVLHSAAVAGALFAGAMLGVILALWGAERTGFVWVNGRLNYVPHTYTGLAVSFLFLGRLIYRLFQAYGLYQTGHVAGTDPGAQAFAPAAMARSPLTVGLFFVLVGYYVCYYSLVLRKAKHVAPENVGTAVTPAP